MRYSRRVAGVWLTETIPGAEFDSYGTDASCALALDSEGFAHVVVATNDYCDEGNYYYGIPCRFLDYFTNESGSWQQEERYWCTRGGIVSSSIAISNSDSPGIAYSLFGASCIPDGLWYTRPPDPGLTAWTHERVDSTPGMWGHVALAFDSAGQPHICYDRSADVQVPAASLKHAARTSGQWITETVEGPSGWFSRYPSLAIDVNGDLHVAYYETTANDLVYARRSANAWTKEIVDADGDVGKHPSISVDPTGDATSIAYQSGSNGDLRYAFKRAGQWTIVEVDTVGDAGRFTSLALDFTGIPHMTYWAAGLRYARALSLADPEPTPVGGRNASALEVVVYPNPSRLGQTHVRLTLAADVEVRLDVLDASGRHVRTLSEGPPAGASIVWDGLDARARRVAAGTYFIRATVDGKAVVRQVQIIR